jgi:CHAT domain-containing protein
MKFLLIFCLLIATYSHAQDAALMQIINSNNSLEIRQKQIDSLLIIKRSESQDEALADFYHDLGSRWYQSNWWDSQKNSDIEKAIFYAQKAYGIKKNIDNLKNGSLEKTLFNLGYFHQLEGKIYEALDFYQLLVEKGEDPRLVNKGNDGLGTLYMTIGDFYKALDSFSEVIHYCKQNPGNESTLVQIHIQIAHTYSLMNIEKYSQEIQLNLAKADSIFKKSKSDEYYFANEINQLTANRLLEMGQYADAIPFYQKLLKDSVNLFNRDIARVFNSLAYSELKLEDFDTSYENLNKAISYDVNYTDPYENLGDLYVAKSEFEKGLNFYQKAILLASNQSVEIKYDKLPALEDLETSPNKIKLLEHIIMKANGWLKYYEHDSNKAHLTHALGTFTLADKLVDIIRSVSTEYQSKLFWREKGASLYAKAVEVCYLLDKPLEAYYFMERNKALLLLEDISNEQAKEITKLPNVIAKREFELKQAIFIAENELQNSTSNSQDTLSILRSIVYDNKRLYNSFVDSLSAAFPEYAKIKKKVDVIPYNDFKANFVSEDELVLQYILNDEQGYGLMTSAVRTHFFKLEKVGLLNDDLVSLYGQLTDMVSSREKMARYTELSNSVFLRLVPEEVYKEMSGKKLTIIADHILQQIPFESLVIDKKSVRYLIEEVEIRYAYSMSYLDAKKEVEQNPEKDLLGVAPVHFASLGLPDLAFSGEEVNEVNKIFEGHIALNDQATKNSLLSDLNNFKIVHLSTHADIGEGGNPWIAFSDEKLFLNEIYANKNQADMVVLSGCNTSLGELKKGEGAMSLARGFFHSGAKSVVSSLWTINDKTSKDLMASFYQGLDKGMTKAAAIRKAKIDYIEQYRGTTVSPSFWAALIVIGDNSPISNSGWTSTNWTWVLFGLFVTALFGVLLFRKKKRRSVIQKKSTV